MRLDRTTGALIEPEKPRIGTPHVLPLDPNSFTDVLSLRASKWGPMALSLRAAILAVRFITLVSRRALESILAPHPSRAISRGPMKTMGPRSALARLYPRAWLYFLWGGAGPCIFARK